MKKDLPQELSLSNQREVKKDKTTHLLMIKNFLHKANFFKQAREVEV
jgi:hypothetical protein